MTGQPEVSCQVTLSGDIAQNPITRRRPTRSKTPLSEQVESSSIPVRVNVKQFATPGENISVMDCCRNIALVLKNSVRRRVFPQGSFFPFVLFFFGSLFLTRLPSLVALSC